MTRANSRNMPHLPTHFLTAMDPFSHSERPIFSPEPTQFLTLIRVSSCNISISERRRGILEGENPPQTPPLKAASAPQGADSSGFVRRCPPLRPGQCRVLAGAARSALTYGLRCGRWACRRIKAELDPSQDQARHTHTGCIRCDPSDGATRRTVGRATVQHRMWHAKSGLPLARTECPRSAV